MQAALSRALHDETAPEMGVCEGSHVWDLTELLSFVDLSNMLRNATERISLARFLYLSVVMHLAPRRLREDGSMAQRKSPQRSCVGRVQTRHTLCRDRIVQRPCRMRQSPLHSHA